jgi:hypothetical protein
MTDPRFFRKYLDIIAEAPQPTAQQAADLDKATGQVAQGADKFSQGDYAGGTMDVAKGINATADAAGMSTADKIGAAGMGLKAAGSAGLAYLRGKDPAAAAIGSVAKNLTDPLAKTVNDPTFQKNLKTSAAKVANDPTASEYQKQMATDIGAGKIDAQSLAGYANRMQYRADQAASGETPTSDPADDSPYIQHSGLKTADTAELDSMKNKAVTGQLQPVPVQEDEIAILKKLIKK